MKKRLCLLMAVMIFASCSGVAAAPEPARSNDVAYDKTEAFPSALCDLSEMIPLSELPEDYLPEQAAEDGCVVYVDFDLVANAEIEENFQECFSAGEKAEMREYHYITLKLDARSEVPRIVVRDKECNNYDLTTSWYNVDEDGNAFIYQETARWLADEQKDENGQAVDEFYTGYGNDIVKAMADGCVIVDARGKGIIFSDGEIKSGVDKVYEFIEKTKRGEPATLRVACWDEGLYDRHEVKTYEYCFDGEYYYSVLYTDQYTENWNGEMTCTLLYTRYSHMVKLKHPVKRTGGYILTLMQTDAYEGELFEDMFTLDNIGSISFTPIDCPIPYQTKR